LFIFKAAVVGAGAMGGSIAQVISYAGLPVVVKDVDQHQLDLAMQKAQGIYEDRVKKGKMNPSQVAEKMSLIIPQLTYDGFDDVDIVIEAVPEKMNIKQAVLRELDGVCHPGAIFASNTSALSISEMAEATNRPNKVIGMHFFNPAHVMKLVEVIPGQQTDDETIDDVSNFARDLRKIAVVVKECPGFLVNRLLAPYLNEAAYALQEGAASTNQIDGAATGAGMPMGPFMLSDMLGLDICYHAGKTMYEAYGERMRPAELMQAMYDAGRLGQKAGRGFYTYGDETPPTLDELITQIQRATGKLTKSFNVDRILLPMMNEAALALDEGIAGIADINTAMMAGAGMPVGPLAMADEMGLDEVLKRLEAYEQQFGPRFTPAPLIRQKVAAGELGKKSGHGFMEYA
jgi:3-hydroxyacyl-CoA dehydrogenase